MSKTAEAFDINAVIDWTPQERLKVVEMISRRIQARGACAPASEIFQRAEVLCVVATGSWEMIETNHETVIQCATK